MRLDAMAARIGAEVIAGRRGPPRYVKAAFSADKVSDILNAAGRETLLITNLSGPQLLRVAELMEIPGICLLNGATPDAEIARAAERQGTFVMVSPLGMSATRGRIHALLGGECEVPG